jgi:hypothetical protein
MTRSKNDIKKYQSEYRKAHKKQRQEYDQSRYSNNKKYFENKNANYYLENKEHIISESVQYYLDNKNSVKEVHRAYINYKRKNDISFNLRSQVSKSIARILKVQNSSKMGNSVLEFLPYSIQELKIHIEKQFESWMTWDNWGKYNSKSWNDNDQSTWTWNIDHIVPQSKLLYASMLNDNFRKCWSLKNLRPLSSKQNLLDGNRR